MNGLLDKLKETGLVRTLTLEQAEIAKCGFGTGRCGPNPHLFPRTIPATNETPVRTLLKNRQVSKTEESISSPNQKRELPLLQRPEIILGGIAAATVLIALAITSNNKMDKPLSGITE